jgi:hypothetical protein
MEDEQLLLLRLFLEAGVEYVVIGGYAVIAHGYPRYTADLYILIRPTVENGQRAVAALERFGRPPGEFEVADFVLVPHVLSFSQGSDFDLLTATPGVKFEAQRLILLVGGVPINFINLAALRKTKLATGRLKDLLDLENLPLPD